MDSDENDKKNLLNYFVVKKGILEKNETSTDFSKEFIAHMLDEFKLTDYLEKKFYCKLDFFWIWIYDLNEKFIFLKYACLFFIM